MRNSEKITVAICNYNHEKYLKQSIASIQNQTWENLDIVVVDDASTNYDLVMQIVTEAAKLDTRIRYITFEQNCGKWAGLNAAIRSSDAPLFTSHDADDISLPARLERQFMVLKQTNSIHNLCGFFHCWNEDDVAKYIKEDQERILENITIVQPQQVYEMARKGYGQEGINHYFTGDFETAGVSALFYKSCWDIGIRFNPPGTGLRILNSEDSDFNLRMTLLTARSSILKEEQYCYRRNTSTNNEQK
jgi:glycosyltransferase involved in cell wall biosynthesis